MSALRLHRELAAIWATGPGLAAPRRRQPFRHRPALHGHGVRVLCGGRRARHADPRPARHPPTPTSWIRETYNQVFTVHGSMMLFLFAIPMIEAWRST